jgi:hypothetical protein
MESDEASGGAAVRIFADSGVLIEGLFAPWSESRAPLILTRGPKFRLLLAAVVRAEVERNLRQFLSASRHGASVASAAYAKLLRNLRPEVVPPPAIEDVAAHRHLIRHAADVPVLLSAMVSAPDFLVTMNTRHFTSEVAKRTGLRMVTPRQFLTHLRVSR